MVRTGSMHHRNWQLLNDLKESRGKHLLVLKKEKEKEKPQFIESSGRGWTQGFVPPVNVPFNCCVTNNTGEPREFMPFVRGYTSSEWGAGLDICLTLEPIFFQISCIPNAERKKKNSNVLTRRHLLPRDCHQETSVKTTVAYRGVQLVN